MVCEPRVRFTDPRLTRLPPGAGRPASGSGRGGAPVVGAGLRTAPLDTLTPPVTRICDAVTWEVPLADRAVAELESTTTAPATFTDALPVTVRAPPAAGSRTKIDEPTVTEKLVGAVWPPTSLTVTVTVSVPGTA